MKELTAKELYNSFKENVFAGKWFVERKHSESFGGEYITGIQCESGKGVIKISSYWKDEDVRGIIAAVNGTWNKGLDPEKMEELWHVLQDILSQLEISGFVEHNTIADATETLKTARIK